MRRDARVLIVGVGGLGCPAATVLARAGVGTLVLCDDDVVDVTNLHRQILFGEADVGAPKLEAAARALRAMAPGVSIEKTEGRFLPRDAVELARGVDLVVEGADNFATKFLVADACRLAGTPVVHASAVRWVGTALAVTWGEGACYRCVFEDVPGEDAPNCAEAGVLGPVVGVVAAAQADLALALLDGVAAGGTLVTFDGRTSALRRRSLAARAGCPLCGPSPRIRAIEAEAYVSPACAG